MNRQSLLFLTAISIIFALAAQNLSAFPDFLKSNSKNVTAKLVSDVSSIEAGQSFDLALHLQIAPGWHTYHVSESMQKTTITWELPDGFKADSIRWMIPMKMLQAGKASYGYEGEVYHFVKIHAPSKLNPGDSVTLNMKAEWFECSDKTCVPGSKDLSITLPIADKGTHSSEWKERFEKARSKIEGPNSPKFMGLVNIDTKERDLEALPAGYKPGENTDSSSSSNEGLSLFTILYLAFFGGFILNLMPCVFPVIGIKILSFTKLSGEDNRLVKLHGLVFSLGVIISFMVLAAIIISLRGATESVGWGFQMQNPIFIQIIAALFLLLGLNMSGVFTVGESAMSTGSSLANKSGLSGSFFSGVFATVAATPCSAPMMGSALGATLTMGTAETLLVFLVLALGMSLPYLVLSVAPSLVKYMPKPGAWMESLKQFLAFPLYATVGYLMWTLGAQVDDVTFQFTFYALTLIGLAAWVYGRWNAISQKPHIRRRAKIATILILAGAAFLATRKAEIPWETWSPEKVAQLRAEGKTVFIDFTARWCLNCQVNKSILKSSREILEIFHSDDVVTLKADWTKPNALIKQTIAEYGRAGVPVNVVYRPGEEANVLPEALTHGNVLEALKGK